MAHFSDKIYGNLKAMQAACVVEVLTVDGGIVAGSTLTVAGAFTQSGDMTFSGSVSFADSVAAASDFNTSGCVQIGATGTNIFHILAGSVAASTPAINASATGTASATVTGLTTAHKLFVSCSAVSGCLTMYNVYCAGASAALVVNFFNGASENVAEDTGVKIAYFAIRDA